MGNILADNDVYIILMCSMISSHNAEGLLHMFHKDMFLIWKLVNLTVLMGYHPIVLPWHRLIVYIYIYI